MSQVEELEGVEDDLMSKINGFLDTLDDEEKKTVNAIFETAGRSAKDDATDDSDVSPYWWGDSIFNCAPYATCWYSCLAARGSKYAVYCGDYCHRRYPGCK